MTLNSDIVVQFSKTQVVTLDSDNQQLPESSPSLNRRVGEYSEPSSPLRSSPPTGVNSPSSQLSVIVQNPLIRANSAPGSLAIAPSAREAVDLDQGRQKFPLLGV